MLVFEPVEREHDRESTVGLLVRSKFASRVTDECKTPKLRGTLWGVQSLTQSIDDIAEISHLVKIKFSGYDLDRRSRDLDELLPCTFGLTPFASDGDRHILEIDVYGGCSGSLAQ